MLPSATGNWTEKILVGFSLLFQQPYAPQSGLAIDSGGNLYGTTGFGGEYGGGTVYKIPDPNRTRPPVFSLTAGTYTSTKKVSITDPTPGATIYYTTNGSVPTASSTKYTGAIPVQRSETIKAIATAANLEDSLVATAKYIIQLPAAAPVFSLKAGTYHAVQHLTITDATADASIYFTINGTTPTTTSRKYAGPISISETEVVKAIAIATGKSSSPVTSAAYVIQIPVTAKPVFSPQAGAYSAGQRVTITCATAGAVIYYTTGAKPPTTASPKFPAAGIVLNKSVTIQAIAMAPGHTDSAVATAAYTVQ